METANNLLLIFTTSSNCERRHCIS